MKPLVDLECQLRVDAGQYRPEVSPQLRGRIVRALALEQSRTHEPMRRLWLSYASASAGAVAAGLLLFIIMRSPTTPAPLEQIVGEPRVPATQLALAADLRIPQAAVAFDDLMRTGYEQELRHLATDAKRTAKTVLNALPVPAKASKL